MCRKAKETCGEMCERKAKSMPIVVAINELQCREAFFQQRETKANAAIKKTTSAGDARKCQSCDFLHCKLKGKARQRSRSRSLSLLLLLGSAQMMTSNTVVSRTPLSSNSTVPKVGSSLRRNKEK
jgi:hypothetical protein